MRPTQAKASNTGSFPCYPPSDYLFEELVEQLGMSPDQIGKELGIEPATVELVLMGREPITPDLAEKLGKFLETSPDVWLNLQRAWDAWRGGR